MEVIENNYNKNKSTSNIVCPECESKLRITKDDIKELGVSKYVKCPLCNRLIFISDSIDLKEQMQCEECGELFEPEYAIGALGCKFAKCTKCGHDNYVDDGIPLTSENIEYPVHFFHYNKKETAKVTEKQTNKWIKECVKKVENGEDFAYISGGDTIVFASASYKDDEIAVFVCKGYSESVVAM